MTTLPVESTETFEIALAAHIEMCYAVALSLTRDPETARELASNVITSAWLFRSKADSPSGLKKKLLTALRETFVAHYQDASPRYTGAVAPVGGA